MALKSNEKTWYILEWLSMMIFHISPWVRVVNTCVIAKTLIKRRRGGGMAELEGATSGK